MKFLANNEVKNWREEKEKDKMCFKEISKQEMEHKKNMEEDVIKIKNNIIRDTAEKKRNVILYGLQEKIIPLKIKR